MTILVQTKISIANCVAEVDEEIGFEGLGGKVGQASHTSHSVGHVTHRPPQLSRSGERSGFGLLGRLAL